MTKIADALEGVKPSGTPDAATLAKLQKLSTEIDQAKLTAASAHISAWVQKNCKRVRGLRAGSGQAVGQRRSR